MRSVIDIVAVIVLAGVAFMVWSDTPSGKLHLGVKVTEAPKEENIIITSPARDEHVFGYINISGEARVPKNLLNLRVRDQATGEILIEDSSTAIAPEVGSFGQWQDELNLSSILEGKHLLIEVYDISPKDDRIENLVSVPVVVWHKN